MKLYLKLAITNLTKQYTVYKVFLFGSAFTWFMYAVFNNLMHNESILEKGLGRTVTGLLNVGSYVVIIFTITFILYCARHIITHRSMEMGLYRVLGMNQRQIYSIVWLELTLTMLAAFVLGLILNMIIGRLLFYGYALLVNEKDLIYHVSFIVYLKCFGVLLIIQGLISVLSYHKLMHTTPLALMHSEKQSHDDFKYKSSRAIMGSFLIIVPYLYIISVRHNPFKDSRQNVLLILLILTISIFIGTMLFYKGTLSALLNSLKKSQRIYYKKVNYIALSQISFRIKKHSTGLGILTLLLSMLMVTLSSVFILNAVPSNKLAYDIYMRLDDEVSDLTGVTQSVLENANVEYLQLDQITMINYLDNIIVEPEGGFTAQSNIVISEEDAIKIGLNPTVSDTVGTLYTVNSDGLYVKDALNIETSEQERTIKLRHIPVDKQYFPGVSDLIVVSNPIFNELINLKTEQQRILTIESYEVLKLNENQIEHAEDIVIVLEEGLDDSSMDLVITTAQSFIELETMVFPTVLMIGLLLGTLFLVAAISVMYYKYISEGYEDKKRYLILKNIGLSKKETKHIINRQILVMFGLPLALAITHTVVGMTFIGGLMRLLDNRVTLPIILSQTGLVIILTTAFYLVSYKMTSSAYYRIINQ